MREPPNILRPHAILFDLDGTITEPLLDFSLIRREMGLGGQPILEALSKLNGIERDAAIQILLRHETEAAERSTLNPGCRELLNWLNANGVLTAVVTRNSLRSARRIIELHSLPFEVLVTRDDGIFKPDPQSLLLACQRLNVEPSRAWIIGDGVYDVQAGIAARVATVWLSHGKEREFPHLPWRTVRDLMELHQLLANCRV